MQDHGNGEGGCRDATDDATHDYDRVWTTVPWGEGVGDLVGDAMEDA